MSAMQLARAGPELQYPVTEQHRGEVPLQLVRDALLDRLADDVPHCHDHDVAIARGGPRLLDGGPVRLAT